MKLNGDALLYWRHPAASGELEHKMSYEDVDYYQQRAEAEIELAQKAEHVRVVQAHYELASAYLDRIHGDTPRAEGGFFSS